MQHPRAAAAAGTPVYGSAGRAMQSLNTRAMSKNDPRLLAVKRCCDQAVARVFSSHATVQLQGSTAKGTALQGISDWDLFVRLDSTIDTVTGGQRVALMNQLGANLAAQGIHYRLRCGEYVTKLWDGQDAAGSLPEVDVVLQQYKNSQRVPPNSKALADSHAAQQVVRYLKGLRSHFSNLPEPKSSLLEQVVKAVDSHLRCQQGVRSVALAGAEGFDLLLTWTLRTLAGVALQNARGIQDKMEQAGVRGQQ